MEVGKKWYADDAPAIAVYFYFWLSHLCSMSILPFPACYCIFQIWNPISSRESWNYYCFLFAMCLTSHNTMKHSCLCVWKVGKYVNHYDNDLSCISLLEVRVECCQSKQKGKEIEKSIYFIVYLPTNRKCQWWMQTKVFIQLSLE